MKLSISMIKAFLEKEKLEYEYFGNDNLEITGFCPISEIKAASVTWIKKLDNFDLSNVYNSVDLLIVADKLPDCGADSYNFIVTNKPKMLYFEILNEFFSLPRKQPVGISPSSTVETTAIGNNVSIGHNCFIGENVKIGNNTIIRNGVIIECPAVIGEACIIESGTVIGCAGYGYYTDNSSNIKKVPDLGGVIIGDRVEIGANTCIARGTLEDTIIGNDVKICDLCHIGHNVHIKDKCYIVAMSMVAGSVVIEKDAYVAPGAMIMNQIKIGENAFIGMGAVVTKDVGDNKVVAGVPAKVLRHNI